MNFLLIFTVISVFERATSEMDPDAAQCLRKCATDNDLTLDTMIGKCVSNNKLNKCIQDCKSDQITLACNTPPECLKMTGLTGKPDDSQTAAEYCRLMFEHKECTLAVMKYLPRPVTDEMKQEMERGTKLFEKEQPTDCKNIVDATAKYVKEEITFEQLEKVYAENNSSDKQSLFVGLGFVVILFNLIY